MPKFANLANENIMKVGGMSFVMNEPSDSMNDEALFAFLAKMSFNVFQRIITLYSFIFVS